MTLPRVRTRSPPQGQPPTGTPASVVGYWPRVCVLDRDSESLVAVGGSHRVRTDCHRFRPGEPGHWLVTGGVVNQRRTVGLYDNEYLTVLAPVAIRSVERGGTGTRDDVCGVGHGPGWSRPSI